ncbi:hypothetical protein [Algirhabdus cladophorae]|uniref:hypothetical protein n=1 Tax=Algirhabdus cladophorae TaxID=3377108 RepID=UPI003B8481A5
MRHAVVMIHGMGEQIPMETLTSFVDATWTTDLSLVGEDRKDVNTGEQRTENASWGKPDQRNRSFELRRIATEKAKTGVYTDFYEFYWAHLITGNTWDHVAPWLTGLVLRNPFKRVPAAVRFAWCVMAMVTAILVYLAVVNIWNVSNDIAPGPRTSFVLALAALAGGYVLNTLIIPRLGDVARYIKASPPNVANRQKIRSNGVELLETLMHAKKTKIDRKGNPYEVYIYDRIIVASHSLGTIVAYDILTHTFGRNNRDYDAEKMAKTPAQPHREALEKAIQTASLPDNDPAQTILDIEDFQALQDAARAELNATGNRWIISDFVTMGSPLTHAEFLMAYDKDGLRADQAKRILPTCPPVLEWDERSDKSHFTYRRGKLDGIKVPDNDDGTKPAFESHPRIPHHAAMFAYTRWSNLFSKHRFVLKGDLVSGPVADQFALQGEGGPIKGVKDIPVLPDLDHNGQPASGMKRGWVTHNNYWNAKAQSELRTPLDENGKKAAPHHIQKLRAALRLGKKV